MPSINQATKHAWIPQNVYVDTVVDMPVAMHQQVPQVQTVPVTGERPAGAVHRPERACLRSRQVTKLVEISPTPHTDKVVDVPAIQRQVPQV